MFRLILSAAVLFFTSSHVCAAELTPDNIVGHYKVSARAGFMKVYLNFHVVNTNEFEIQRTYSSGKSDEVCNGTYDLNANIFWDFGSLAAGKIFKGAFTCPSNRSKTISFNINFKDTTTEDLVRGTTVTVTSSMAPGRSINAHVIRKN